MKNIFCDILLNHNIYTNEKNIKTKCQNIVNLRCGAKYTL